MKPEAIVKIKLWNWLKTEAEFIEEIYFNRKNSLNAPTFQTKGINKKPDFILKINKGYGINYCAIEIKNSSKSKNILDAGKILDVYYINYIHNKTKYYINKEKININHFVVASENSMNGFLFKDETIVDNSKSENKGKLYAIKNKLIPRYEGEKTYQFIRTLWNNLNRIKIGFTKCSLGILIGDKNNYFCPKIMVKIYVDWLNKKPTWQQRFWEI